MKINKGMRNGGKQENAFSLQHGFRIVSTYTTKASERRMGLPEDVAYLIAKRMRSNVRDLEGALNTLAARSNFMGKPITPEFAQETLRDLLRAQAQVISISNIQKTVADYYQLRMADMLSKRRTRSLARPRQMAMALAKDLTEHSLPEIGDAFGGLSVPWHLTTAEFIGEVDRTLRPDGRYLMNLIDGPELRFVRAETATLRTRFEHVAVVSSKAALDGSGGGNVVLVASHRPISTDELLERATARGETQQAVIAEPAALDAFVAGAPVLTDDFAPVDQLIGG